MTGPTIIFEEGGKWWFWDEVWCNALGPFDTEAQAKIGLEIYCEDLNGIREVV